jgi:hypothetical protein
MNLTQLVVKSKVNEFMKLITMSGTLTPAVRKEVVNCIIDEAGIVLHDKECLKAFFELVRDITQTLEQDHNISVAISTRKMKK